ncbi:tryptophan synthase subunit alpha [Helicobacter didelphidarum]|uniref:tryptophan synthase n=1 Tax=Helicobacter didelphidarum TaxID=2040648 RepID=A0A3D8IGG6_9HELI|nr:tryptophan synthase subunit alpha [Helicobacter didelphidarum]RDU64213.1 tryptophan synthase subunit alpha [Helicobacter didelphidarum]
MKERLELMGHIVAGYPSISACLHAGRGILRGGANLLEVQFPFSEGNADGVLIQDASNQSIKHGFTPKHGFTIIDNLVRSTSKHILAMTYANLIISYGIKEFVETLKHLGAYGLIVPDFSFGQDDFGLRELCVKNNIYFIELIAPLTPRRRIHEIAMYTNAPFLYVITRNGLTGNQTQINHEVLEYIEEVNAICELASKKIMVGFGINNPIQLTSLANKVYGVIAGSYFVDIINQNLESENLLPILQEATEKLLNY